MRKEKKENIDGKRKLQVKGHSMHRWKQYKRKRLREGSRGGKKKIKMKLEKSRPFPSGYIRGETPMEARFNVGRSYPVLVRQTPKLTLGKHLARREEESMKKGKEKREKGNEKEIRMGKVNR